MAPSRERIIEVCSGLQIPTISLDWADQAWSSDFCEPVELPEVLENRISTQVSHDHRSFERNLSNCKQKPEGNCLNCVQNCDDHGLLDFKSAVQYMKCFIYHFSELVLLLRPSFSSIII